MAYCSIHETKEIRNSDKGNTLPLPHPSPQWWGCGAAGIKSEKYFLQMIVNIAWHAHGLEF